VSTVVESSEKSADRYGDVLRILKNARTPMSIAAIAEESALRAVRPRLRKGATRPGVGAAAVLSGTGQRRDDRGARRRPARPRRQEARDETQDEKGHGHVNAYTVLKDHHKTLKALIKKISELPAASAERQALLDELLSEVDIHFRIEDDLYYPALSAAGSQIAIAHAEHRQVIDQLSVLLRTPPTAPTYEDEWRSFVTVLAAHADEEERDMIPVPASVHISDAELVELGEQMNARIEELRGSTVHRLRVKSRKALLHTL